MSMISGLIDELNKSADEWNGSNMFELARMCREAADTITELRGALQVASVDYRHLSEENAKLRELVDMMSKAIGVTVDDCHGDCIGPYECTLYGGCPIQRLMRELGIEVDE